MHQGMDVPDLLLKLLVLIPLAAISPALFRHLLQTGHKVNTDPAGNSTLAVRQSQKQYCPEIAIC